MSISVIEYEAMRQIVDSDDTKTRLLGESPDDISLLGGELAIYYARLTGEKANIKDEMDELYIQIIKPVEEGGEGVKVTAGEKIAEVRINAKHEVTRRQIEGLMDALDAIRFAAQSRVTSFKKEGNF